MIVFSAITSHSPLLIPSIGKENRDRLALTLASFNTLRERLELARPDVLVILSPHGTIAENSFPIFISPEYQAQFEQFGDFQTHLQFPGDVLLPTYIKQKLEADAHLTSVADIQINHGISIPTTLLDPMHKIPIAPFGPSLLDFRSHFDFGLTLAPILNEGERRIAVIASAEFSHRLGPLAPFGYSPHGATFDAHLMDLITRGSLQSVADIDPALVRETGSCGIGPIVILAGILNTIALTPDVLSYEAPFGIGYATIDLKIAS